MVRVIRYGLLGITTAIILTVALVGMAGVLIRSIYLTLTVGR